MSFLFLLQISFEGLSCILEAENRLEVVRLLECNTITRKDYTAYTKLANRRKWKVDIEWT